MSENGRGGNNRRRSFRKRERDGEKWNKDSKHGNDKLRFDKNKGILIDRPRWVAPKLGSQPLPKLVCTYCGKPIHDVSMAVDVPESEAVAHFDCVRTHIAEMENLDAASSIVYIGGGRFGVVHFQDPNDPKTFRISKVIQWEQKDKRASWRKTMADNYSTT